MKFSKILSVFLVIIMLASLFVSCSGVKVSFGISGSFKEKEDDSQIQLPSDDNGETLPRKKVTAHFKVLDHTGKEVYSTEVDEPFEYDSAFFDPTIIKFVENYCFMNENKIECSISNNVINSVSVIRKGVKTKYAAGETVISELDGSEQITFWVCEINGKEVDSMKDTIVKEGDVVALRLAYLGSDKVVESEKPDYTTPAE